MTFQRKGTPELKIVCGKVHFNSLKAGWLKGLGTHLFVKVSRPGDSEVIFSVFESNCHLLLPV